MPITPNWVFNLAVSPEPGGLDGITSKASMAEVMALMGKWVVSGPVDIDWTDRYGWTAMTFEQLQQFSEAGRNAAADALRRSGLL